MDKIYLEDLKKLTETAASMPDTRMMALGKINALILLNMRYEKIMLNRNLAGHPYKTVSGFIKEAITFLEGWRDIAFIEAPQSHTLKGGIKGMEEKHKDIFQRLWVRFSKEDYQQRIERYVHRLRVNNLDRGWLKGFRCIDFGCGHGNFAHALIQEGAAYVYGLDYGEASIKYANCSRDELKIGTDLIKFDLANVYDVPREDGEFDFAIQNGVFHHLEDENLAIKEMHRVLKVGGWIWYYTDGAGGISYDLWDSSVEILKEVEHELIVDYLSYLNIEVGKRYHLGDGLKATYRHTTWEEITSRLESFGFGNFRRLVGGFPTDFDGDVIAADKFGKEKFGSGDLRLLAQKIC